MVKLEDFDYYLPPELIAQTPLEPRDASRLMVIDRSSGSINHHTFADLANLVQHGDILIANNSRVIPARLFARKETGGKVEILLLKQIDSLHWEALVGGKRLRPGLTIHLHNKQLASKPKQISAPITLTIEEDLGQARRLLKFNQPLDTHLRDIGHVPLPPYIHTPVADEERYQTVFSRIDGSVAAPTAGLHFSPEMLFTLRDRGITLDYVTLHIGLDTFKPVTVEQIEDHPIHREFAQLTVETAQRINQSKLRGGRLVAVGTTAVRTLETAALRGAGQRGSLKSSSQLKPNLCPWQAVAAIEEETDLFIYPGFTYRAVDVLLTNFHLPKSSLLMLVSAFAGHALMQQAYQEAMAHKYRFFSFGDAMLIL